MIVRRDRVPTFLRCISLVSFGTLTLAACSDGNVGGTSSAGRDEGSLSSSPSRSGSGAAGNEDDDDRSRSRFGGGMFGGGSSGPTIRQGNSSENNDSPSALVDSAQAEGNGACPALEPTIETECLTIRDCVYELALCVCFDRLWECETEVEEQSGSRSRRVSSDEDDESDMLLLADAGSLQADGGLVEVDASSPMSTESVEDAGLRQRPQDAGVGRAPDANNPVTTEAGPAAIDAG